jgi:hypothetical protein
MTEGTELRAIVVVAVVSLLIAGAFAAISAIDVEDRVVTAPASTTTTTTTTVAPLTDEDRLALVCDRAAQFIADIEPIATEPVLVMRVGEGFYTDIASIAPLDLAAEYEAALDHYADFNAIGEPLGYDTERILREGDGLRWEQLVTRDPFAVNITRQNIAFICGIDLPPPYAEDPEDFADVKEKVDRELNPERYTTTTTAPTATAPPAAPPA